jgi:hypothetical protein
MKFSPFRPAFLLAALVALGLAGCATEVNYTTGTSDGQRLTFRMINGQIQHASEAGIQTDTPRLDPNPKEKTMVYLVRFIDHKDGPPPRSVKVEDVSAEEPPVLLVEDTHPQLIHGEWRGASRPFTFEEPAMKWLTYLDQSFRVYRFTIVLADGRTIVLHEGLMVPGFGKAMIRKLLGQNY